MRKLAIIVAAAVAVGVYKDAKLVIILEGIATFVSISFSLLKNWLLVPRVHGHVHVVL
jgi:hypothetical protein